VKLILTAALYAAFPLAAEEPDWGKIVDAQSKPYNPHHPDHHDHSKHPSTKPYTPHCHPTPNTARNSKRPAESSGSPPESLKAPPQVRS